MVMENLNRQIHRITIWFGHHVGAINLLMFTVPNHVPFEDRVAARRCYDYVLTELSFVFLRKMQALSAVLHRFGDVLVAATLVWNPRIRGGV